MKTKYILTAIGIFLILIGVMGIGIYYNLQKFGNKPIHSLRAARDAIESRDLATFKSTSTRTRFLRLRRGKF